MKFIQIRTATGTVDLNPAAITAVEETVDGWTVVRQGAKAYYTRENVDSFKDRADIWAPEAPPAPEGDQ